MPVTEPPVPEPPAVVLVDAAGGGGLRQLFGVTIPGIELGASLGLEKPRYDVHLRGAWFHGDTPEGLGVETAQLEAVVDGRVGSRLRLGMGTQFVYFRMSVAGIDAPLETMGLGLQLVGQFDVARFGRSAVFLAVRLELDSLDTFHNPTTYWGPTALAGWRF